MTRTGKTRILIEAIIIVAAILITAQVVSKHRNNWSLDILYRLPTEQKLAALTFDDGPHPVNTPQILKILKKNNIKATFFMIGKEMEKYPDVVKAVVNDGHVIGNHTYSHPHNIELDTRTQVAGELKKCESIIEKLTGKRTYLFRPPRGLVDGTVFMVADEEGYQVVLWTVSADHHEAPTPQLMAKRVLQHIKPGAIILAHDGLYCSRIKDVEATPLIIDELKRRGYKFVSIPELIEYTKSVQ